MIRQILITVLVFLLLNIGHAQKQANIWYFSRHLGLDFNSGSAEPIDGILQLYGAGASMSDSLGNFLFATNGETILNKNGQIMMNGDDISGSEFPSEGSVIVQKPGSDYLYYVFNVVSGQDSPPSFGLRYSVVDIRLDNGLGAVTNEKNILLTDAWDGVERLIAVRHANGSDIWIISYKMKDMGYATFLLTKNGVENNAVISETNIKRDIYGVKGQFKISYDKKYLVSAFGQYNGNHENADFEILTFNANTGQIELQYILRFLSEENNTYYEPFGVEFSPDSKFLYLANYVNESGESHSEIYQLDMQYVNDSASFFNSRIKITDGPGLGLQLATDGKIYGTLFDNPTSYDYISVIHEPWKKGTTCNYEADYLFMGNNSVTFGLQNVLLDYLYRFEWEGRCSAEPFVFQSNFQPNPAYIRWSFSDPAAGADSISFDLNPVHYFTHAGEFEVKVFVQYPSGRIEETSRVVTVIESPHPDLGPDTLKCEMGNITLNAGDDEGMFVWSNGTIGQNVRQIIVSDTGWYWVQVTNGESCRVRDSIYVGFYPKAIIDETNLSLIATSCGGSNGKVLGLAVSGDEPLSFEWYDAGDNLLGTALVLLNLPVGNYFLHILDGHGCTSVSEAYTIEDAGDITISLVEKEDAHCGQNSGSINITAVSADPDNLLYSIDNGNSWQTGNSLFENLPFGNYFIRVKDLSGCETVFENNPVTVVNIPGPEVSVVNTVPEIDYLQNGEIDISASANSGQLYYSIDNGSSFQTDDGLFDNLSAGTYTCVLKDDFGCDTVFTVVINRSISQLIEAIAGNGYTCIGNAAVLPIKLNNFTDIFKFHVKLTYDTTVLSCDGTINVNTQLEANLQASIIPGTDEIIVSWQGETPTTLEENATMLELVFGAKKEGLSGIDWAAAPGESTFYNENMEQVNTDFHVGKLRVYTRPEIFMSTSLKVCEGGELTTLPFVSGGSGNINYEWFGPGNFYSTDERIKFYNIQQGQAGIYTLKVTDTIDCVASADVDIKIYESPQIAFAGQDTIFAQSGFILEAGSGYVNYLWNTSETSEAISIKQEGDYWVEVSSAQQCKSADTVTILWGGEPFYLPNAFSPDGDGLNDEFKPIEKYDFVKTYQLSIFNRWGQLIFETSKISQGWDGTYQGKPVEQGTYVYKIVFTAYPDYSKQQVVTGNVVVVR